MLEHSPWMYKNLSSTFSTAKEKSRKEKGTEAGEGRRETHWERDRRKKKGEREKEGEK